MLATIPRSDVNTHIRVPQPSSSIPGTRDNHRVVGTPGNSDDSFLVVCETMQRLKCFHVVYDRGSVLSTTCQFLSIVRERDLPHFTAVFAKLDEAIYGEVAMIAIVVLI